MPDHRRHMTAQVVPLSSDAAGDSRMGGTIDERVAAVAELSEEAWRLSGGALPANTRATMPVAVIRLSDDHGSCDSNPFD